MEHRVDVPSHHRPDGGFTNPWPNSTLFVPHFPMLRWQWQRIRYGVPPTPPASAFPLAVPDLAGAAMAADEARITWLGHASFLIQLGGTNLLTDPALSRRASPFAAVGPARVVAAPLTVAELPRIDGVLISHDHYDHLDGRTCRALIERFGAHLPVFTPLGYRDWFARIGAANVCEHDWWQPASLPAGHELIALPSQHWTRRVFSVGRRLWCSWLVRAPWLSLYFCGDSGYCPAFADIHARTGAPDIALMPIGAYEPRWLMKPAHMNPEEAVQAYLDLGARDFVAMHWGTFRLTDEPMLEPPVRLRSAWRSHGLPADRLHIPQHGETLRWRAKTRSTT